MSRKQVKVSPQEFARMRKSGLADFIAHAHGYVDADAMWAHRTSVGGLPLRNWPENNFRLASFVRALYDRDYEAAVERGWIQETWRVAGRNPDAVRAVKEADRWRAAKANPYAEYGIAGGKRSPKASTRPGAGR